jgi:hypothetical protein
VSRRVSCRRHGRATGCTPATGPCLHHAYGFHRACGFHRELDAHQPPVPRVARAPFLAPAPAPFPAKTLRHPQLKHHACAPLAPFRTPLPRAKALRVSQKEAGLQEARPPQVLPLTFLLLLLLLPLALKCVEVWVGASATQLSVRLGGGAPPCAPLALAAPTRQKRPNSVKRDLIGQLRVWMREHTCKDLE